ncbi:RNA polymerase subunit sigma [Sphingomonas spermidinifaciens]|uniref:RNA polymerase subunit sigma n=1 Tax=Sphingomonas spermidinifaciens TaxID=1141889 RepID=A0A2A4B304_9SPHN|nr:sigma factor-like helix-turn-helix DNA-binding protein [Sphingomonas spermidinifaciens]PCD02437.1 RNA polymerase subunit sigma [Sphingomonas spermidinifaciens]
MSEHGTQAEIIERLEAGLQRMPRLQREIFLAIRLDDLSYAEIAERTGLSVKQVERHFARCMMALIEAAEGCPKRPWWKRAAHWIAGRRRR